MSELRLHVGGMGCRHCVREVTSRLRDVPGVRLVTADAALGTVTVVGDVTETEVLAALAGSRFHARLSEGGA